MNYSWNVEWDVEWFVYVVYYVDDRYIDDRYKIVFDEWIHLHFDNDVNLKKKFRIRSY